MAAKCKNINIKKSDFTLQNDPSGQILIFHHTLEENNTNVRIRMISACFNYINTQLVSIDSRGHVFVFDLCKKKFWKLIDRIPNVTVIKHVPPNSNNYIVGTSNGNVILVDINYGVKMKNLESTHEKIQNISFASMCLNKQPKTFLVHSDRQALLINLSSFELSYRLKFDQTKAYLKFAMYIPKTENILSCFNNDSMVITTGNTLEKVRTLHPIHARDRYLKLQQCEQISLYDDNPRQFELIINSEIKDYSNGLINHISFSSDGAYICLSTIDSYIVILSSMVFDFKVFKLRDTMFLSTAFMLQVPFGLMLFGITSINDVVLLDCNDLTIKSIVNKSEIHAINISTNGKLMFIIQKSGEVCVYLTSIIYNTLKTTQNIVNLVKDTSPLAKIEVEDINPQLKKTLNRKRLLPILKEYGHYPDKFRHLIWCTLFDLPSNKSQFALLIKMGDSHPSVKNLGQNYLLKDGTTFRNLKRIISYLSHWSKIFAHTTELPKFVFPFIEIFPHSLILVFELIVTLLLNQCQLWFEFHPLEPMNYFGICENILKEFEPNLWKFFVDYQITPKIYAWPLMITAFSEVLDKQQWFHLWDNILTYPPYFPIFCIVAYSIVQCKTITNMKKRKSIVDYFHDQNIIDMKKFINKAIKLMEECPTELHPKQYMSDFQSIPHGFYPKFEYYPEHLVEQRDNEAEKLKQIDLEIDAQIRKLEQDEVELEKQLQAGLKQEEFLKRTKAVERAYQEDISSHYEQIELKRKFLGLYHKQNRKSKSKVLTCMQESAIRCEINVRESELDSLMRMVKRGRQQDESLMMLSNDQKKTREIDSLIQQHNFNRWHSAQEKGPSLVQNMNTAQKLVDEKTKSAKVFNTIRMDKIGNKRSTEDIKNTTSKDEFAKTLKNFEVSLLKIKNEFKQIKSTD